MKVDKSKVKRRKPKSVASHETVPGCVYRMDSVPLDAAKLYIRMGANLLGVEDGVAFPIPSNHRWVEVSCTLVVEGDVLS